MADNSLIPDFEPGNALIPEDMPADAPEWAHVLHRENIQVMQTMNATMHLIESGVNEIKPLADSLSSHPMFKLLGGKR